LYVKGSVCNTPASAKRNYGTFVLSVIMVKYKVLCVIHLMQLKEIKIYYIITNNGKIRYQKLHFILNAIY